MDEVEFFLPQMSFGGKVVTERIAQLERTGVRPYQRPSEVHVDISPVP
jgi:hypothetical protein